MKTRIGGFFLLAATSFFLLSCSVVSENVRKEAVSDLSFNELRQNTQQYIGRTVILGGYILETRNLPDVSKIIVLQTPLEYRDRPESREGSEGRFMVVREGFLDPEIYKKDKPVTVAGKVEGKETVKIQEYSYPIVRIRAEEIYLWEEKVYRSPYYYDPWYYDPFYYDPFYPWIYPRYRFGPHPYWW